MSFNPPEEFSEETKLVAEGYWSDTYLPKPSKKIWLDKEKWVEAALLVCENTETVSYRGFSLSRLDGSIVGSREYVDKKNGMRWPHGYIEHYIRDHNVPPTKKFYNYIIKRHNELI